jgi:hypothetical protein
MSASSVNKIPSRHRMRADWAPVEEHISLHAGERFAALTRRRPSPNAVVGVASRSALTTRSGFVGRAGLAARSAGTPAAGGWPTAGSSAAAAAGGPR